MKTVILRLRALLFLLLLLGSGRLGAQPTWQWANAALTARGNASVCRATAVDAAGNTVVVGTFTGSLTLGSFTLASAGREDLFVARLSPAGAWTQAVRAGGTDDENPAAVVVDANGTVTVAGYFASPSVAFGAAVLANANAAVPNNITPDAFVAQLSSAGTWVRALGAGGTGSDVATALAFDGSGGLVVAGTFENNASFGASALTSLGGSDVFVASLGATGSWTRATQAGGAGRDYAAGLAVESSGSVLVAGTFTGASTNFGATTLANASASGLAADLYVARLSPAGTWASALRAGGSGDEYVRGIALSATGEALVYGSYSGTAAFGPFALTSTGVSDDIFVARLSPANGWTQATSGGGPSREFPTCLAVDPDGTATVSGYFFTPTSTFGPITLQNAGPPPTSSPFTTADGFVARLSPTGNWVQALAVGGAGDDLVWGLAGNGPGSLSVCGAFASSAVSFGTITLTTAATPGLDTGFVARLTGLALAARAALPAEFFTLSPNPATAQVRLAWPEATPAPRSVRVLDQLGREVRRQALPTRATTATLEVAGLAPGLYVVRCGAATGKLMVE